jgi:hypothetical protein
MLLQLRRPPALEGEFVHLINEMHDKTSPNFRHWLTPQEIGDRFGPAQQDLDTIKSWLQSKGFTVHYVYPTRMVMDISATAGVIRQALHTEIHNLEVGGQPHWANVSDPRIPEALAPAIVGIVSIHDFRPHPMYKKISPAYTSGSLYALLPADIQVIYNVDPLLRKGIQGQGQTVVVVEDSNVSSSTSVNTYRSTFLSKYATPALVQSHPDWHRRNMLQPWHQRRRTWKPIWTPRLSPPSRRYAYRERSLLFGYRMRASASFGGLIALENLVSAGSPPSPSSA